MRVCRSLASQKKLKKEHVILKRISNTNMISKIEPSGLIALYAL